MFLTVSHLSKKMSHKYFQFTVSTLLAVLQVYPHVICVLKDCWSLSLPIWRTFLLHCEGWDAKQPSPCVYKCIVMFSWSKYLASSNQWSLLSHSKMIFLMFTVATIFLLVLSKFVSPSICGSPAKFIILIISIDQMTTSNMKGVKSEWSIHPSARTNVLKAHFCKTTEKFKLYISLCCNVTLLYVGLKTFSRVTKTSQTQLETSQGFVENNWFCHSTTWSPYKYQVVSYLQMLKRRHVLWSLAW